MRRIFAYQSRGEVPAAVRSVAELEDPLLLGSVLADRYLGRYHRASSEELRHWLEQYAGQPETVAVHALLVARSPKGEAPSPPPVVAMLERATEREPLPEDINQPRNDLARNPALDRTVLERAERGGVASALRLITATKGLSAAYASQLRAEVAQVLFTRNEDAEALRVARLSLRDVAVTDQSSLGYYIGGLSAWRLGRIDQALDLFEGGASAPGASARSRAASAFWASRSARAMHDIVLMVRWLRVAAQERLTFHGLLARRILRMDTGILPGRELLAQADVDAVAATPQGWRAFALLQIGQADRAEAALRTLWPEALANPVFGRSLMMVASSAGLADCAAQMASLLQEKDGLREESFRFPMPRLRPNGGFSIDPSLVYALTRLESNFDAGAISAAGARGLMQIMPATAEYITGDAVNVSARLHEPAINLQIGQRYISYLSQLDGIGNDLLRILASYNSGPGSFLHWSGDIRDHDDPLLFVEAIPVAETRSFVQHALAYSWIYAARMHLPAPSLDELAAGEFPRFTQPDHGRSMALSTPQMH